MLGLIRENVYVLRLWDGLNNGWRYVTTITIDTCNFLFEE
jgi:hypothetical protein